MKKSAILFLSTLMALMVVPTIQLYRRDVIESRLHNLKNQLDGEDSPNDVAEDIIEIDVGELEKAVSNVIAAFRSAIVARQGTELWNLIPVMNRYYILTAETEWNVTKAIIDGTTDLNWRTLPAHVQNSLNIIKEFFSDPSRTLGELGLVDANSDLANSTYSDLFKEKCQPIINIVYDAVNQAQLNTQVNVRVLDEALVDFVKSYVAGDNENHHDLEDEKVRNLLKSRGLLNEPQEMKCYIEDVLQNLYNLIMLECFEF